MCEIYGCKSMFKTICKCKKYGPIEDLIVHNNPLDFGMNQYMTMTLLNDNFIKELSNLIYKYLY